MDAVSSEHWILTGTTASGKTAVGVELARMLNAEIVSVDSMTVYRAMDLGTAKPSALQRARAVHHLIDVADPNQLFNLHDFLTLAHAAITDITARGKRVLLVGGTPLYLKGLLRGVLAGPPADAAFRREVQQELAHVGPQALHHRLEQVDPLSAARLHPHDSRRIIRALEVYKVTGRPISHLQLQFDRPPQPLRRRAIALAWPRPVLHQRADYRVHRMFQQGLVDEVQQLVAHYGPLSHTACQAVGYREVLEHLAGGYDRHEAERRTQVRTHRLARRQETWFRRLPEVEFLPMGPESPQETARRVLAVIEATEGH